MKTCKWCVHEEKSMKGRPLGKMYIECYYCERFPREIFSELKDTYRPIVFNEEGHSNEEEVIANEEEK